MSIFKKKPEATQHAMTNDEIIIASTARKLELENQKKRLPKYDRYFKRNPEIDALEAKITVEETKIELARQNKEAEIHKAAPKTLIQNNQKTTKVSNDVSVKINSDNQKGVIGSFNDNKLGNKSNHNKIKATASPQPGKKKSKARLILFWIVAILVLAGVIAITVKITKCVYDGKNNSSSTHSVQTI